MGQKANGTSWSVVILYPCINDCTSNKLQQTVPVYSSIVYIDTYTHSHPSHTHTHTHTHTHVYTHKSNYQHLSKIISIIVCFNHGLMPGTLYFSRLPIRRTIPRVGAEWKWQDHSQISKFQVGRNPVSLFLGHDCTGVWDQGEVISDVKYYC